MSEEIQQEQPNIEDHLIGKFKLDDHPLFRSKDESDKLVYNKKIIPPNVESINESIMSGEQPG